jgi:hypothetical protein
MDVTYVFTHMFQVFYLDVAYVSHICCKCFIWMLHMFQQYVSNVSSMSDVCCIQVFHGGTVSDGCMARGAGVWGAASWGPTLGCRPCGERERDECVRGKERGIAMGQGARARRGEADEGGLCGRPDARSGGRSVEGRGRVRVGARWT